LGFKRDRVPGTRNRCVVRDVQIPALSRRQGNIARWIRVLGFLSSGSLPFRPLTGRVGISARYRIPDPLDLWRRALDCVSALYSMIGKLLLFNRQRSPQCLHHTLNEFSALMRQQGPELCSDQRVARRPRSAGRQQGGPSQLHEPIPHEPIPNARLSPVRLQRRELASRSSDWAQWLTAHLTNSPITPNQISMLSVGWAAMGSALLSWNPGWPAFIAAAVCVQQRLLCNLLDGMVALKAESPARLAHYLMKCQTACLTHCFWYRSATLRAIRG
jgi:hypothetical protein